MSEFLKKGSTLFSALCAKFDVNVFFLARNKVDDINVFFSRFFSRQNQSGRYKN